MRSIKEKKVQRRNVKENNINNMKCKKKLHGQEDKYNNNNNGAI